MSKTVTEVWNMACPVCQADERLDIEAIVFVRLTPSGTDAVASELGEHTWDGDSGIRCADCGHSGTVKDFKTE